MEGGEVSERQCKDEMTEYIQTRALIAMKIPNSMNGKGAVWDAALQLVCVSLQFSSAFTGQIRLYFNFQSCDSGLDTDTEYHIGAPLVINKCTLYNN